MKQKRLLSLCLALLPLLTWAQNADFTTSQKVIGWLRSAQTDSLGTVMTSELQQQLPPAQLAHLWKQLEASAGPFREAGNWSESEAQGHRLQECTLTFERAALKMSVTLTADKKMAGLFFAPVESTHHAPTASAAPDTVARGHYTEREVIVKSGELELPGTICLPKATQGPLPFVVFVHGSGPNDRNETLGPNSPFRDLAHALAANGIASLRYDKRTLVYRNRIAEVKGADNYDTEVTEDAVAALCCAAAQPEADTTSIYVLGHSLGGALAPRIAALCPFRPGGLIAWSAPARPLPEILREQLRHLSSLQGRSEASADSAAAMLLSALPESYLAMARQYEPVRQARFLPIPQIYIAGGHDYQVTKADFDLWQKGLQRSTRGEAGRGPGNFRQGGRSGERTGHRSPRRDMDGTAGGFIVRPTWLPAPTRGEGMPRRPEGIAAGRLPEGRLQPAAPQFLWIEDADHLLRHLPQLATPTDYNTYLPMAQEAIQAIVNFILPPAAP